MLFVDEYQKIDREAMRLYVLRELTNVKAKFETLMDSRLGVSFFSELHDLIGDKKNQELEEYRRVERQIRSIPHFIGVWIQTAVDSEERIDFFVKSKAAEITSGDVDKDYFWAMQIRHDQLVALVRVLKTLQRHFERWLTQEAVEVIDDPVFQGMIDYSIEEQVYLEAEQVHKEREKMLSH